MRLGGIRATRAARLLIAAALAGVTPGAAGSRIADAQGPQTPAELARAIAETVRASTHTPPGSPIALATATSHDNVVELAYVVTDAAAFARFKSNAARVGLDKAFYYCNPSRIFVLNQGVVIHEVTALADHSDEVGFTIDKSSCDRLPRPTLADPKTLAELARAAAKAENEEAAKQSNSPLRLAAATAHEGIVDLRYSVDAAAAARVDRTSITGILTGYMCGKYRDSIARGLALHPVFTVANGPAIIDFIIDRSKC